MTHFTVFGGSGFIGRHIVAALRQDGHQVVSHGRDFNINKNTPLGHVIYAAGATGGSSTPPITMLDVHATLVEKILSNTDFSSFVYLSSTRVYGLEGQSSNTAEDATLGLSTAPSDWFALTKLCGESLCLNSKRPAVSVARLSNVYGVDQHPSTFLSAVRRDCLAHGGTTINETPQSCKDYISITDAVRYLCGMATAGIEGIYNVASGSTTTHSQIADTLGTLGFDVAFNPQGVERHFPAVKTEKIRGLFGAPAHHLIDDLPTLFARHMHA